jgi:RNA polymerase sigma-70 factor (ECF subfamily)
MDDWEDDTIERVREALAGRRDLDDALRADFDRLLQRHVPRVVRFCRSIVGNDELAQEVAQDAMLTAYRKLPEFEGRSTFSTWLCGIARLKAFNAVRKRTEVLASKDDEILLDLEDPALSVLRSLSRQQRVEFVRGVVADVLTPTEQELVHLRFVESMPLDAITQLLELSGRSGARGMLQTCKRKLGPVFRHRARQIGHGTSFLRPSV